MISLKSKPAKKLLNYFFINPQESLYLNELSAKLQLDKRNLVKKLKELEKEGIIISQKRGNLKFYRINTDFPLYAEYRKIVSKTIGLQEQIRSLLEDIEGIKHVYIYGSYAKDTMDAYSDIDLLAVGGHSIRLLQDALNKIQKDTDREINVVNMDEKEFKKRLKNKDPFIINVTRGKHVKII